MNDWIQLGTVSPETLEDIRLQLHYAAMLTVAPAHSLLPHREDFSEDALAWLPEERALRSDPVQGLSCILKVDSGELFVSAADGSPEGFVLNGLSLSEARRRLAEIFSRRLQQPTTLRLPIEDYGEEMPPHSLGSGDPFHWDAGAATELGNYYANAALAIEVATAGEANRAPLRVWPHHLDMAVLVTYGAPDKPRYVGVGYSPGDTSYPPGYFYVNPWPAPDPGRALPELPREAHWHRAGWTGAVLESAALTRANDQETCLRDFQKAAIELQKRMLDVQ